MVSIPRNSVISLPKNPNTEPKIRVLSDKVFNVTGNKGLKSTIYEDTSSGLIRTSLSVITSNQDGKTVKCAKVVIPHELINSNEEYAPLVAFIKNAKAHFGDKTASVFERFCKMAESVKI